jgi:hypothetical protein
MTSQLCQRILTAAGLLAGPALAAAQDGSFRVPPSGSAALPAERTQAVARTITSTPAPFVSNPFMNPYSMGFPGWGGYFPGAVGGALQGQASVISSQGQFAIQQQQALMENEKVKSARIDRRRQMMEEYLWERENLPTLQDDRERSMREEFRRSRNDPPATEIWSGKALNDLLTAIQGTQNSAGLRGPSVSVDPELVRRVNFTTGTTQASTGIVRDGKLSWPFALRRPKFDADRELIDKLVTEVVSQVRGGSPDAGTLAALNDAVRRLRSDLRSHVADLPPNEYVAALQYVNQLNETLRAVQQPGASETLRAKAAVQANTIGELVDQMSRQGLRFAPAAQGDERFYTALHQAMVAYDAGLARVAAR